MISIIVAMGKNRVIGKDGKIPWIGQLPVDLARFRNLTFGYPIIMGRKTHEAIARKLKGRTNIVVSKNKDYSSPGCIIKHSLGEAIKEAKSRNPQIFVIGGESLYRQTIHLADELIVTFIDADFEGDSFFPEIDPEQWEPTKKVENFPPDQKNKFRYSFITFRRRKGGMIVYPLFASDPDYRKVLEQILQSGKCPFCKENFSIYHREPILQKFGAWFITKITWPYENASLHFLLISDEHKEEFGDLTLDDFNSVKELVKWAIKEFRVEGGAIALRFGDPRLTRSTVKHLHFHLIVPEAGESVSFFIG